MRQWASIKIGPRYMLFTQLLPSISCVLRLGEAGAESALAACHIQMVSMMRVGLTSSSVAPNIFSRDSRKYFWSLLAKWLKMSIKTTGKAVITKVELAL